MSEELAKRLERLRFFYSFPLPVQRHCDEAAAALRSQAAEIKRLREALTLAEHGLSVGVNQYASRAFGGSIVAADEQPPLDSYNDESSTLCPRRH